MIVRVVLALALVVTLAACSSSTSSAPAPEGSTCTLDGEYSLTADPVSGDCPALAVHTPIDWFFAFDVDAGTLGAIPQGAATSAATGDAATCTARLDWSSPASGACAVAERGAVDLTFDAAGFTGTLDFTGCSYAPIGLDGHGCTGRYALHGVRK